MAPMKSAFAAGVAATLAFGLLVASCSPGSQALARRPPKGIVVIVVDTLRADFVGLYGAEWPATPAIDALGRDGVTFDAAFAQASWTHPSVPTLLTGLYPSEHHLKVFVQKSSAQAARGEILSEEAETVAELLQPAGYRTALAGFQAQLSPRFRLDQGFDRYNSNLKNGAGQIVDSFLSWVDEEPERPFFAYLHFLDIHWPYCPPARLFGRFDPAYSPLSPCSGAKELLARLQDRSLVPDAAGTRALRARYAEKLLSVDEELDRLFTELRRRRLWDDLAMVVTSDHGQEFGEHGGWIHGETLYDEMLHVPFVWKLPEAWAIAGGRRVPELVETRSLLPTLAAIAGVATPARVSAPSLLPWLLGRGGGKPVVPWIVAESNGLYAVRDARFKLVIEPAKQTGRLYDLVADPGERVEVAETEVEARERLREAFRTWRAGLAPLPTATAASADLDAETEAGLRALGYLQ